MEWCLTQEELASLLSIRRVRISNVERGQSLPKGSELLAYTFIFGCTPESLFPALAEEIQDTVMRGAYRLSQLLEGDASPQGRQKNELLQHMLGRVTSHLSNL
jgi:transcriptional regulator with XRE-family HTH domain